MSGETIIANLTPEQEWLASGGSGYEGNLKKIQSNYIFCYG
jgi:hypothetical protein